MLSFENVLFAGVVFAICIWFACMIYMAIAYAPIMRFLRVEGILHALPLWLLYYLPVTLAGLIVIGLGVLVHTIMPSNVDVFVLTLMSERLWLVAVLLLIGILVCSGIWLSMLRVRLRREYHKYHYLRQRIQRARVMHPTVHTMNTQLQQRKQRLLRHLAWGRNVTSMTAVLGLGIMLSVSVLRPAPSLSTSFSSSQLLPKGSASPFNATVSTVDKQFSVSLTVTPNHFGPNVFMISVTSSATGQSVTTVHVSLALTMRDMAMGISTFPLQPDGAGHFTATGTLAMTGHWEISVLIRTPDAVVHKAVVELLTAY